MLPTSNVSATRLPNKLPEFVRRLLHRDQMELDSALSQMWSLLTSPSMVLKVCKARKMTKNHYFRDDPAFNVLQVFFLLVCTLAFGLSFGAPFLLIIYNIIYQIAIDYLVIGALIASAFWSFANRVLMVKGTHSMHEVRRDVEWRHAFDIHCNSYFVYFWLTHVVQFILLPILMHKGFFAQLLANLLYAAATTAYFYNTFRSYLDLPMLGNQTLLLYPALGAACLFVLMSLATSINMTHMVIHHVWPEGARVYG